MTLIQKLIISILILIILILNSKLILSKEPSLSRVINQISKNITESNNLKETNVLIIPAKQPALFYDKEKNRILISTQTIILSSSQDEISYLLSESLALINSKCEDFPCIVLKSLEYMENAGYNSEASKKIIEKLLSYDPADSYMIERALIVELHFKE